MEKKNLIGTAKSCVHPPAQLPGILVTRLSAAPLADLSPTLLGPGARESALSLKWVTLQRSTSPPPHLEFAWGQHLPSEEGGKISREGLASLEKENTFHLAHLSAPLTCMMLLLGLRGALWVSPPQGSGLCGDSSLDLQGCPGMDEKEEGPRMPVCKWKTSGSTLVSIWSELRQLRWFSKHAALGKNFIWL